MNTETPHTDNPEAELGHFLKELYTERRDDIPSLEDQVQLVRDDVQTLLQTDDADDSITNSMEFADGSGAVDDFVLVQRGALVLPGGYTCRMSKSDDGQYTLSIGRHYSDEEAIALGYNSGGEYAVQSFDMKSGRPLTGNFDPNFALETVLPHLKRAVVQYLDHQAARNRQ